MGVVNAHQCSKLRSALAKDNLTKIVAGLSRPPCHEGQRWANVVNYWQAEHRLKGGRNANEEIRANSAAQLLLSGYAVMFGVYVLIGHAQAQPGYVPPPTPLPPPVLNPSNPGTVPQPSYRPITPTTPGSTTVPSGEVRSPVSEEAPNTTPRPERETSAAETRTVRHYHRARVAGITWPYYCGSSPCVRIVVDEPPPVYRASVLWWPGFYDYADGQFTRGHPRYGGYPRRSGYHGD
jgi:hypothetical protein